MRTSNNGLQLVLKGSYLNKCCRNVNFAEFSACCCFHGIIQ